ncbi:hypothetical protein M9H77_12533 [Catharanthus roseus]|uniref:Uncharacterized protein n=1 Tax=Catharanthus roseus TaxID=4058 RepID=A0ACC0BHK9_CATRO|nr:hypothetical protein M9H77_12533 [Catharanthus roseus]
MTHPFLKSGPNPEKNQYENTSCQILGGDKTSRVDDVSQAPPNLFRLFIWEHCCNSKSEPGSAHRRRQPTTTSDLRETVEFPRSGPRKSFNDVKSTIKCDRDGLSLSDVKNALKSQDLDLQKENKFQGENLFVRGRVDLREPPSHRFKSKGRSKSREKNKVKCFYCGKEGRMKNKCFKRIKDEKQRKHGKGSNKTHDFDSDGNSMFSEVLCVSFFFIFRSC